MKIAALGSVPAEFPLVFNTVPAQIVTEALLAGLPAGAVLIDLASAPYGDDAGDKRLNARKRSPWLCMKKTGKI